MSFNIVKMHEEVFEDFLDEYRSAEHYGLEDEKEFERRRKQFVKDFSIKKIKELDIYSYVIGDGSHETFCYRLERELRNGGSILGSTAQKFGVFYSREKRRIVPNTKYNNDNVNEVYEIVKSDIITIIEAAKANEPNKLTDKSITLPYTVRWKIYNVYNSKQDLPIFSFNHLEKIIDAYGIDVDQNNERGVAIREALYNFKSQHPMFSQVSNLCFSDFLYNDKSKLYLKNDKKVSRNRKEETISVVQINEFENQELNHAVYNDKEPNWNEIATKRSYIGEQGEEIVLKVEQQNKPQYKRLIKKVSDDYSLGYDIDSVNHDGSPLHIEVKTKVNGSANNVDFFISSHEVKKMEEDPCYVIYYVCGIKKKNKTIYVIDRSHLNDIKLNPVVYRVKGRLYF